MLDGLQFDIMPQIHERIYEFSSPSLYPLSPLETAMAHKRAWRKGRGREAAAGERRRNGMKTLSLHLFNADRHVVERVLTDGTRPAQRIVARLKQDMA